MRRKEAPSMSHQTDAVRTLVVALGGNAILRAGDDGSIATQIARADAAMACVAHLALHGHRVALTHGNGPVVGNIVLRNEAARDCVTPMPLYIAGADSQGGIGVMLQMSLENALLQRGIERPVATVMTQTVVDPDDPAFARPTKPIGPRYSGDDLAAIRVREPSWSFAVTPDGSWRRVVPSPKPLRIVEAAVIARLVRGGVLTIGAGGGGVPVVETGGRRRGVDAVIDKDRASALLASEIGADLLIILMEADRVYRGWGTAHPEPLDRLSIDEAQTLLDSGALDEGSMGPKVDAGVWFARHAGRTTIVCRCEDLDAALAGRAGTRIG
jgi:carbamate kinase